MSSESYNSFVRNRPELHWLSTEKLNITLAVLGMLRMRIVFMTDLDGSFSLVQI